MRGYAISVCAIASGCPVTAAWLALAIFAMVRRTQRPLNCDGVLGRKLRRVARPDRRLADLGSKERERAHQFGTAASMRLPGYQPRLPNPCLPHACDEGRTVSLVSYSIRS